MSNKQVPGFPEPPFERYWDMNLDQCIYVQTYHKWEIRRCKERGVYIDTSFHEESFEWLDRRIDYLKTVKLLGGMNG